MLIALLALFVIAGFVLRELIEIRRQISSIRQSIEWYAVGFMESRKEGLSPTALAYLQKTKEDLLQEGLRDGTLTTEQANHVRRHGFS
jgi:hypothetical protein